MNTMLDERTRDAALLADQLVHEQAAKVATAQGVSMEEAVEGVWASLEAGLLRFANSDEHFWIEPCGATAEERLAARMTTRQLIKCRKQSTPPAAAKGGGSAPQPQN